MIILMISQKKSALQPFLFTTTETKSNVRRSKRASRMAKFMRWKVKKNCLFSTEPHSLNINVNTQPPIGTATMLTWCVCRDRYVNRSEHHQTHNGTQHLFILNRKLYLFESISVIWFADSSSPSPTATTDRNLFALYEIISLALSLALRDERIRLRNAWENVADGVWIWLLGHFAVA